jgi:thiamine biosynthesis lipoprotein
MLDPTGFVKGWAAERASQALLDAGFTRWCLNVGGDAIVHADPATDPAWRVGLVDPFDRTVVRATIDLHCGALATSGTAERGLHLVDERTGTPATEWVSFTVMGPSLTWADAFATTACALGAAGPAWVCQFEGYEVIAIRPDGRIERRSAPLAAHPVGV